MTAVIPGAQPVDSRTSSKSAKSANRVVLVLTAALILLALALSYGIGAQAGIVTVALGCIAAAGARAVLPESVMPAARSRWFDIAVLLAAAVILFAFLPVAGPGMERPILVP